LRQALGNPLRQGAALDRLELRDGDAVAVQRAKPRTAACHALSSRGSITMVSVLSLPWRLGASCCRATLPSLPGLPLGMRISTICLVGKQAERTASGQHLAPVEVRTGHGVRRCVR
jgi:hypothetical protein